MAFDATSSANIFSVISNQQYLRESAANSALSSGITLMEKKKYAEAVKAFKQATAYKPEMPQAHTFLGDAYARLGKKTEAAAAYELSLKVDKTQDTVYSSLANIYVDQRRPADAEKTLKKALQVNNQNTPAYYTLGLLQSQRGDYKSAEAQFRQVVKLEPKDGNGYYGLGMALNGQGKYRDALNPLEQATKFKKNFDSAYYELGKAYVKLGETDKVQTQIDRLHSIYTSIAANSAADLEAQIKKPGLLYYASAKSSLNLWISDKSIALTDSTFLKDTTVENPNPFLVANASKDMTVIFAFDSDMDPASVTNAANWSITKASGGSAGIYNNGLYNPLNVPISVMPKNVSYDPGNREAKLVFTITQNSTTDGVIDLSHLVFRFKGTDDRGMTMDPTADEFDAFHKKAF